MVPYIRNWRPQWHAFDQVTDQDKERLVKDFWKFARSASDGDRFTSPIPFRIAGRVYDSEEYEAGDIILTSTVRGIKCNVVRGDFVYFEVVTKNNHYVIYLNDAQKHI